MESDAALADSSGKIRFFVRADAEQTEDARQHRFIARVRDFNQGQTHFPTFSTIAQLRAPVQTVLFD